MATENEGNAPSAISPDFCITIIHGTWGRGLFPKLRAWMPFRGRWWFEPQSQFCIRLAEELSRREISARICAFEWSGANSALERDCAGAALAARLSKAAQIQRPVQVLIGHSHGGNVAIRALHHLGAANKPILLVTLATPFVEVLEPKPAEPTQTWAAKFSISLGCGAGFTYFWLGNRLLSDWSFTNLSFLAFWIIVFGLIWLLYWLIGKYQDVRRATTLACATSHEGLRHAAENVLILRGVDDEAALALALGAIGNRITTWAARVLERFYHYLMTLWIIAIGCLGVAALFTSERATADEAWLIGSLHLFVIVLFAASVAAVLLMALAGLFKAVYGREFLFGPIASNISSHSVPDIIHNRVRCITLDQARKRILRHQIYDEHTCTSKISDWLDEQLHSKDNVQPVADAAQQ